MKQMTKKVFTLFSLAKIPLLSIFLLIGSSCSKDSNNNNDLEELESPKIELYDISDITSTSAKLEGCILNYNKVKISDKGFLISTDSSTSPNMSSWGYKINVDNTDESLETELFDLKSSTTYYVVAYATINNTTTYTHIKSFTTKGYVGAPISISVKKTGIYYSAGGFNNSSSYKYKLTYDVNVYIKDYSNITECGFKIGSQKWNRTYPTEDYTESMNSFSESASITKTITAYAVLNDGTEYTGNTVTVSDTYSGGGSPEITSKRADNTSARTVYIYHNTYSTYESMKSHLNIYGLTIYKNGNSYYWKDFSGSKHSVSPNVSYRDQIYASDLQAGDKNNGYNLKKAYLYVSFYFSAF